MLSHIISPFDQPPVMNDNTDTKPRIISNITEYIKNRNWREEDSIVICNDSRTNYYHKLLPSYNDEKVRVLVLCNTKKRVKHLERLHRKHSGVGRPNCSSRLKYVCSPSIMSHSTHPRLVTAMCMLKHFSGGKTDGEKVIISMKYDIVIIDCGLRTMLHDMYFTTSLDHRVTTKFFVSILRLLMHQCSKVVFTNDRYAPNARHIRALQRFVGFNRVVHFSNLKRENNDDNNNLVNKSNKNITVTICHSNVLDLIDNAKLKEKTAPPKNKEEYKARVIRRFYKRHKRDIHITEGDFACKLLDTVKTFEERRKRKVTVLCCGKSIQAKNIVDLLTRVSNSEVKIRELYRQFDHQQQSENDDDYPLSCVSPSRNKLVEIAVTTIHDYPKDVLESTDVLFVYVDDRFTNHTSLFKLLHITKDLSDCAIYIYVKQYTTSYIKLTKRKDTHYLDGSLSSDILTLNCAEKRALLSEDRWYEKIFAVAMTYPHTAGNIKYHGVSEKIGKHYLYEKMLECIKAQI